jgi:hypothetical protein
MKNFLGISISVIGAVAILYLRFSNPEMTETQLFINHWFDFLVAAVCLVYGVSLLSDKK